MAADNGFGSADQEPNDPETFDSSGVRYVQMDSSSGVVEIEGIQLSASGSVVARSPNSSADTDVEIEISAEQVDRYAVISSNIDQSYRKGTSAPPTRPGVPPQPSIPGSDPPTWRVPVGKIEARHSAVYWNDFHHRWEGTGLFQANEAGLGNPFVRAWDWSGGTPTLQSSIELNDGLPEVSVTAHFGNDAEAVAGQNSSLTLTDQDATGTLKDNYTINWHLPVENQFDNIPSRQSYTESSLLPKQIDPFRTSPNMWGQEKPQKPIQLCLQCSSNKEQIPMHLRQV
ncbi:MAG: hypothetical protein EOP06_03720 [Proteobacteria bacterium]|nr:MAG: hypothetical protein EOP06_03720 [Pseudomonadota bacterium]